MNRVFYPGTDIPVRAGDEVRWYDDVRPSVVVFVIGNSDYLPDFMSWKDYVTGEFGTGIMINTPTAGLVLESEDCQSITLLRSAGDGA